MIRDAQRWAAMDAPPTRAELAEARAAGLRMLGLSLHGARAEVHAWHARSSFDDTIAAMAAARALGIEVAIATTITRSNARVLIEMPTLLKAHGVALWALSFARATEPTFTRTVPRLGLGVPPALAALARARELGLDARVIGLPLCVLGPFAQWSLSSESRAYAEPCDGCAARAQCPGADALYLERFGAGELRTLSGSPPRASAPPIAALVAATD